MIHPRLKLSLALLLPLAGAALPGSARAQVPNGSPPCSTAEYRQFDFWVGNWSVLTPGGQEAGTNNITREINGCVLHEHWEGSKGGAGESFNIYDASRKVWHQTWVDGSGLLALLEGGLEGTNMVLSGKARGPKGEPVTARITWTPLPDGRVRQHWEQSADGSTWTTLFDGYYSKKG
ncbi:MAG: hypothetical protein ABI877_09870 [Gemmatimonadaceae bacterium]